MILQKLQQAREVIKSSKLKKAGHNTFSGYDYFTPEQINQLVWEAEKQTGLTHVFSMKKDEHGIHGHLLIVEIEDPEQLIETMQTTDIPLIKATNIAQQIGGAVTYTLRYMLMTAFDISDNTLDFDAADNREKRSNPVMPNDRFHKMILAIKEDKSSANEYLKKARQLFTFTDDQEKTLADWESSL